MFVNFYDAFYNPVYFVAATNSTEKLMSSGSMSNAISGLQGTLLGQFYAEKNRWVHANQDCQQDFIPTSLVTFETFNRSLSAITELIEIRSEAVLSINAGQISKYYNLPLADCTHTEDYFVVRILVPVLNILRVKTLDLMQVHVKPLEYKGHFCFAKMLSSKYEQIGATGNIGNSGSLYIYDKTSGLVYPTLCKPNKLCKISTQQLDEIDGDACVTALVSKNYTRIFDVCEFYCKLKQNYVFPLLFNETQISQLTDILKAESIESLVLLSETPGSGKTKILKVKYSGITSNKKVEVESRETSGEAVGTFAWTVFFVSLGIVLVIQVYIIILVKRMQALSHSNEGRILYRADSDMM